MHRRFALLFGGLLFLLPGPPALKAQFFEAPTPDSAYVRDFERPWMVGLFFRRRSLRLRLSPLGSSPAAATRRLRPNNRLNTGLQVGYQNLGLNLGLSTGNLNNEREFGDTRQVDLAITLTQPKWMLTMRLASYEGFFTGNPGRIDSTWQSGTPRLIRPDLRVFSFGLAGTYIFNGRRYSSRAAFKQSERQIRSAGSVLIAASAGLFAVGADSNLIHPQSRRFFDSGAQSLRVTSQLNVSILPGYGYNFVHKQWFVAPMVLAGPALHGGPIWTETRRTTSGLRASFRLEGRLGVGYNGSRYAAALIGNATWDRFRLPGQSLTFVESSLVLSLMYRFGELPAVVRQARDRVF